MSSKVQRSWDVVRGELNEQLRKLNHDYTLLAKAADIGYHAARRFVLSGAKNRTQTAVKLCQHFGIALDKTANKSGKLKELTTLVEEVWDGTGPHAELLARLISSTKPFRVHDRAK